jgi:phage terminase small subunit
MVSEVLSAEQMKFVEYLVTGHTVVESAHEVGVKDNTARGWLKTVEVMQELSRATEVFEKEVTKARSRQYRVINKKIMDQIMLKIEANGLANYEVDELIKMLDKSVLTMRNDADQKRMPTIAIQNNNLTINRTMEAKLQQKEFVDKFSELLVDMDPDDIQNVAEAKEKADRQPRI